MFANVNERRAALLSPVIIDLDIDERVKMTWENVSNTLRKRHFRETHESPTRRGQFRCYSNQATKERVEVFFPHNVYPFGVLGIQALQGDHKQPNNIVCLSSGGLSGRVGNTLEGIGRIMFDFFGCTDAMVLDEGYDVFFISNPTNIDSSYKYTNDELLKKVLTFTNQRVEHDQEESLDKANDYSYFSKGGMKEYPLNKSLIKELKRDYESIEPSDYSDVVLVQPRRSQMRSVLIFAAKEEG